MSQLNTTSIGIDEMVEEFVLDSKSNYSRCPEEFPKEGLNLLRKQGAMQCSIPIAYGGKGFGTSSKNFELLNLLRTVGAYDLSLGRILEGHINALLLIDLYGNKNQKKRYFDEAKQGVLFGVWNSELPYEALKIREQSGTFKLEGAKIFCSGASNVYRPIITAQGLAGKHMIILHLEHTNLKEDYSYWNPLGMIGSVSCRFDFTDLAVCKEQLLGAPNDYEREPDFSGGAVRFAAVQLGGAEATTKVTLNHLLKLNRTGNPDQVRRMAGLSILLERGRAWLEKVANIADNKIGRPQDYVHYANMFRTEARDICEEILRLSEMSVGLQGVMASHPLERIHRDLSVYLKQPGPDRVTSEIGKFFISSHIEHDKLD